MSRSSGRVACVATSMVVLLSGLAAAEEWSRFRGPNGSGVAEGRGLPAEFGPSLNADWATEIPFGRSSPVFAGDRVFLTATDGEQLVTLALAPATGRILWRRGVERTRDASLYRGSDSASSSPATDGSNVYVIFHELGVLAYDWDGHELWRHPLGPLRNYYGVAASPVLAGNRLFVVCDQALGSFVLALDTGTGKPLWRTGRPRRRESYATPVLYPSATKPRLLVVYGSQWVDAYEVESGELAWSLGGVSAAPVPSPALDGDRLIVSGINQVEEPMPPFTEVAAQRDKDGDGCLTAAELEGSWMAEHVGWLDIDADGCVSAADWSATDDEMTAEGWGVFGIQLGSAEPKVLWNYQRNTAHIGSPVVYENVLYMAKDSIASSLNPATGEVYKRGRLARGKMQVFASAVAGDGKVYFAGREGQVAVVKAGPQWEVLAVNDLDDEIYATPAIVDGHLYIRTRGHLYSFSSREERRSRSSPSAGPITGGR